MLAVCCSFQIASSLRSWFQLARGKGGVFICHPYTTPTPGPPLSTKGFIPSSQRVNIYWTEQWMSEWMKVAERSGVNWPTIGTLALVPSPPWWIHPGWYILWAPVSHHQWGWVLTFRVPSTGPSYTRCPEHWWQLVSAFLLSCFGFSFIWNIQCHISMSKGKFGKEWALSLQGFPRGASGKKPTCQCRRHKRGGFDPWVGKIP